MARFPVRFLLFAALFLWIAGGERFAQAQSQQQPQSQDQSQNQSQDHSQADSQANSGTNQSPDVDAPQPQKKQAGKPPASGKAAASSPTPFTPGPAPGSSENSSEKHAEKPDSQSPSSAASENPFPAEVSRHAAEQAGDNAQTSPSSKASSGGGSSGSASSGKSSCGKAGAVPSTADANPFPEAISRDAAKNAAAAGSSGASTNPGANRGTNPGTKDGSSPPLPPGVSSSRDSGILGKEDESAGNMPDVTDPSRAKKDTQVGDFYLQREDAQGAYQRYQDAIRFDPTNADAIFGIAEASRILGKTAEAARNYQMYLDIVPDGSKAKRARKALQALSEKSQTPAR